jgi:hypothetical protein
LYLTDECASTPLAFALFDSGISKATHVAVVLLRAT